MARHPNVRSPFIAFTSLALVLALAACGAAVDPDALGETEQEIVGGETPGDTTYDAPPSPPPRTTWPTASRTTPCSRATSRAGTSAG